jgi:phage shock protein PspC (stress-responsive transcriptional regulator)
MTKSEKIKKKRLKTRSTETRSYSKFNENLDPGHNRNWQNPPPNQGYYYQYPPKKFYRSTRNKWLGGVCGGMAEYFNKDPTLVRILWVLITIASVGVGIIGYLAFWIFFKPHPVYYQPPTHYHVQTPEGTVHYHYHGYNSKNNNL